MYKVNEATAFGGFNERDDVPDDWVIINVSSTAMEGDDTHQPLNDGAYDGGNDQQEFAAAVNATREALRGPEPVFVHCALGQSRSVAVLATALAAENNEEFEGVRDRLMDVRGSFTEPASSLQKKARRYLRHTQS